MFIKYYEVSLRRQGCGERDEHTSTTMLPKKIATPAGVHIIRSTEGRNEISTRDASATCKPHRHAIDRNTPINVDHDKAPELASISLDQLRPVAYRLSAKATAPATLAHHHQRHPLHSSPSRHIDLKRASQDPEEKGGPD